MKGELIARLTRIEAVGRLTPLIPGCLPDHRIRPTVAARIATVTPPFPIVPVPTITVAAAVPTIAIPIPAAIPIGAMAITVTVVPVVPMISVMAMMPVIAGIARTYDDGAAGIVAAAVVRAIAAIAVIVIGTSVVDAAGKCQPGKSDHR